MKTMEAVTHQLIRSIAMATDVVAQRYLPRMQAHFRERFLDTCPNAVVTAAIAPRTAVGAVVVFHLNRLRCIERDGHMTRVGVGTVG